MSTFNINELSEIILSVNKDELTKGMGVIRLHVDENGTVTPLNSAVMEQPPSEDNNWVACLIAGGHEMPIKYGMDELNLGDHVEGFKPGLYLVRVCNAIEIGLWPLRPNTN